MIEKNKGNFFGITTPLGVFFLPNISTYPFWKEINSFLNKSIKISPQTKLLLTCSGGPDSMLTTYIILYRWCQEKKKLPNSIKILYYNHKNHLLDNTAEKLVREIFYPFEISIEINTKKSITETQLRKQRQQFFYKNITESLQTLQNVYLCLGHNLNDRLENTYLHINRGSGLKGIVNIQPVRSHTIFIKNTQKFYTILRPLLYTPKNQITKRCDQLSIPYIQDPHNKLPTPRILLRKQIQIHTKKHPLHYKQYISCYKALDRHYNPLPPTFVFEPTPPQRPTTLFVSTPKPHSLEELIEILSVFNLYGGISTIRLQQIYTRTKKSSGTLYIQGYWFFLHQKNIFIAGEKLSNHRFWEQEDYTQKKITCLGKQNLGNFTREITDSKLIGGILRFPQIGDKYKGKTRGNWSTNQKIPLFRRKYLPIIEKNNKIVAVLPKKYRCWSL